MSLWVLIFLGYFMVDTHYYDTYFKETLLDLEQHPAFLSWALGLELQGNRAHCLEGCTKFSWESP